MNSALDQKQPETTVSTSTPARLPGTGPGVRASWLPKGRANRLLAPGVFALCTGLTFIGYKPYTYSWDDSFYLHQSIEVANALWTGTRHGLGAMVSVRPPLMSFMGIPWGRLTSWSAAGKCFLTLEVLTSLLAVFCLYLLLRAGIKPMLLILASVAVVAALGPLSSQAVSISSPAYGAAAHVASTAFLADSLFAWICLAAVLLIPYEVLPGGRSVAASIMRGALWGIVISFGLLTKLNFLYFVVAVVPVLLIIRMRRNGFAAALAAVTAMAVFSAPASLYLIVRGREAFENAKASSFGPIAQFYYVPLLRYLDNCIRLQPGMLLSAVLTAVMLVYVLLRIRDKSRWPALAAVVILAGFGAITADAQNRQVRYLFPAIVGLPLAAGLAASGKGETSSCEAASQVSLLALAGLVAASVPVLFRPSPLSLAGPDALLTYSSQHQAKDILLATDSPTLNRDLVELAIDLAGTRNTITAGKVNTIAYDAMSRIPVDNDYRTIRGADEIVLQGSEMLSPPFTNLRAEQYREYLTRSGYLPQRIADGIIVYSTKGGQPPAGE